MSWNVNQIYEFTKFLARKNQTGGISDTEFFYQWNSEQSTYFQDLKGRWQKQNNGKSGINTGLIENETILTKLTPFTFPDSLTITAGDADKPADFNYRLGLRVNGHDCIKITHSQIASVNNSVIDPPSVADNKYYFTEYDNYLYFLPRTGLTTAEIDYIKEPVDIVWGFTLDVDNRKVYDAGTSVQPLWLGGDIIEITKRALTVLGVSFKDKDMAMFGQRTQITGD